LIAPEAVLRRRSGWEAADLGVLLWQKNFFSIFIFFGLPLGLFFIPLFFLPGEYSYIVTLALWWLKPLFDRLALQVISVRFFETGGAKRILKGLGRTLGTALAGDLLWRRFSPFRSARMPLRVLEKLKGAALFRRKNQLDANGLEFGVVITVICGMIKMIVHYGCLFFVFAVFIIFGIDAYDVYGGFFGIITRIGNLPVTVVIVWIVEVLVESMYVAMGFGVYISSRVETEGWDLELLFKQFGEKRKAKKTAFLPQTALLALVLLFCAVPSYGEEEEKKPIVAEGITVETYKSPAMNGAEQSAFREVLSSKDFGLEKQSWGIRFKEKETVFNPKLAPPWRGETLARFLRGIILAAIAAALVFSARLLLRRPDSRTKPDRPEIKIISHRNKRPQALLLEAEELYTKGLIREAWAACLKVFLAFFASRGFKTGEESTEYEALAIVRGGKTAPEPCRLFQDFLVRWIPFAYGGRPPEGGGFEQSVADCKKLLAPEAAP
jgi:hypothetical protein